MGAMTSPERIYLDNAATSWPKTPEVYQAVDDFQRIECAAAGRGAYAAAIDVERRVANVRGLIAALVGLTQPKQVVFGFNGTDVLNTALHGCLGEGDHVVTTVLEHNSVLRPLRWLQQHRGIEVSFVQCGSEGEVDPDDISDAVRANTRLIVVCHASNVTGALQPLKEFGRIARERDVLFLVDAAQSLGHVPIEMGKMGISLLAAPGHKGLLGPLGTGVLAVAPVKKMDPR